MFRCKECGTEFDVKPDYCDCGNDTFDEIVEQIESVELPKEEPTLPKLENNNPFKFEQKVAKEVVREEKVEKTELIKYIGMLEERIQTLKKFEIKDKKKK